MTKTTESREERLAVSFWSTGAIWVLSKTECLPFQRVIGQRLKYRGKTIIYWGCTSILTLRWDESPLAARAACRFLICWLLHQLNWLLAKVSKVALAFLCSPCRWCTAPRAKFNISHAATYGVISTPAAPKQKNSAKEPFAFLLSRRANLADWMKTEPGGWRSGFINHHVRERKIKINGTARVSFSKSGGSCRVRVKSSSLCGKSFINFYGQGGTAKTIDSHRKLRQVNITATPLF